MGVWDSLFTRCTKLVTFQFLLMLWIWKCVYLPLVGELPKSWSHGWGLMPRKGRRACHWPLLEIALSSFPCCLEVSKGEVGVKAVAQPARILPNPGLTPCMLPHRQHPPEWKFLPPFHPKLLYQKRWLIFSFTQSNWLNHPIYLRKTSYKESF